MYSVNVPAVIIANVLGLAILFVVRFCTNAIVENYRDKDIRMVQVATAFDVVGFFVEMLMYSLSTSRGEIVRMIILLCRTFASVSNIWVSVMWIGFLRYHLYGDKKEIDLQMKFFYGIAGAVTALLTLNLFIPFLFTVDEENVYTRLIPGYGLVFIVAALMIYSIIYYYDYRKTEGFVRFFPIGVFLIPSAIGYTLQMFIYGISLGWASLAISLSGIMMSLQSEISYVDNVTGLANRSFLLTTKPYKRVSGVIMLDIDRFKYINSTFGHKEGDVVLRDFGKVVQRIAQRYGFAVRYTGDEFLLFSRLGKEKLLEQIVLELRRALEHSEMDIERPYEISFSYGLKGYDPDSESFEDIEKVLEYRLNKNKALFYEKHPELDRRRTRENKEKDGSE